MSEYTIAAIPTMYRGRQYRSRLEARWAAFFDILGWRHEYEPFDLGAWSPDFQLFPSEDQDRFDESGEVPVWEPALAEIKPIQEFDQSIGDRMLNAAVEKGLKTTLLLLGTAPRLDPETGFVQLGWQYRCFYAGRSNEFWCMQPALLSWCRSTFRPAFVPDILAACPGDVYGFRFGQFYDWCGQPADWFGYARHSMGLWARATNAVQWRGRGTQS